MRLIDVDKLIDAVRQHEIGLEKEVVEIYEAFIGLFEKQTTAYDVDKVVEELEEMKYKTIPIMSGRDTVYARIYDRNTINKAIEIVNRGGKNDR